jgi:hypothetical protein
MDTSLNTLISLFVVGALGLLVVGVSALLVRSKRELPELVWSILPDDIEMLIKQAVQYATLFVEKVDTEGNLGQFFDEVKDKGQQKLELAIEVASERLEVYLEMFFKERGIAIDVDIPEEFLKDVIQKYVWENPALFPAKAKNPVAEVQVAQAEETNSYVGYRRPARQPGNYPATAQVWSDPDAVTKSEDISNDASETDTPAHD